MQVVRTLCADVGVAAAATTALRALAFVGGSRQNFLINPNIMS
jgi:hypothetical protein